MEISDHLKGCIALFFGNKRLVEQSAMENTYIDFRKDRRTAFHKG